MIEDDIVIEVPADFLENWQEIADLLAGMVGVPAALIMRFRDPDLEVFVASRSEGNPYRVGEREKMLGSGLYCETVIKTQSRLLVPDALADEKWKDNPDIRLDMVSYLGFPIKLPNNAPFGTICVLDSRPNEYSARIEKLMVKFRDLIESHLEILHMNQTLGDRNKRLTDYLMELQALRGLVPICGNCKSIRDENGKWRPIEDYLIRHPIADFSHGVCPKCMKSLYPEFGENGT